MTEVRLWRCRECGELLRTLAAAENHHVLTGPDHSMVPETFISLDVLEGILRDLNEIEGETHLNKATGRWEFMSVAPAVWESFLQARDDLARALSNPEGGGTDG